MFMYTLSGAKKTVFFCIDKWRMRRAQRRELRVHVVRYCFLDARGAMKDTMILFST